MGVYFKVKRGSSRLIGKNRYAVYPDAENQMTLLDEVFEHRSMFFSKDKLYQEKKLGIKLKQESSSGG
jgi:hypothetical protein